VLIEKFHDLCEIQQAPGQTIDLIYNNTIDKPGLDIPKKLLKPWSVYVSAAVSTIVVAFIDELPAFTCLT
jgi:hypothetical protein